MLTTYEANFTSFTPSDKSALNTYAYVTTIIFTSVYSCSCSWNKKYEHVSFLTWLSQNWAMSKSAKNIWSHWLQPCCHILYGWTRERFLPHLLMYDHHRVWNKNMILQHSTLCATRILHPYSLHIDWHTQEVAITQTIMPVLRQQLVKC